MRNSFKYICLLALISMPVFVSCSDDDDETETKPSLRGHVTFDMPEYILRNSLITMEASGIVYPEGANYKWYCYGVTGDSLAFNTITFRVPDSLGSFILTAVAQYEGYYSTTGSKHFTTIDTTRGASLSGLAESTRTFTDPRDGITYDYVTIGSLDWFAQNLTWDGAGVAFKHSPATETLFGRMYHWEEATGGVSASGLGAGPQGACPQGWSVPTNEDWADLSNAVSGGTIRSFDDIWEGLGEKVSAPALFNGERMWLYCPDNEHTNDFGWNALPLGNSTMYNETFSDMGKYGYWWSSTERSEDQAWFRYIYYDLGSFPASSTNKDDFGASVRCVRLAR